MRVWLIKEGEPLPCDAGRPRLFRMGLLARELAARGHEVVWWSSAFNHALKKPRFDKDTTVKEKENYTLRLLHADEYRRNVSFARLRHHRQIARKFSREAQSAQKPDVIVCAMPTIELTAAAVSYAEQNSVPILVDIRDLWPDIYMDYAPRFLKAFARVLVKRSRRALSRALSRATGIVSLTDEFLRWGLDLADREKGRFDRVLHMGYRATYPQEKQIEFWRGMGLSEDDFICCFFGQLGMAIDLDTVLAAARLTREYPKIKYVICGEGENAPRLKAAARDLPCVIFSGWVGADAISALKRIAQAGVIPYKRSKNYEMNIPNKFAEYISEGLLLLISIDGVMLELAKERGFGFRYTTAKSLADTVVSLYSSEEGGLLGMREAARSLFYERFDAKKVYSDYADLLEELG